MISISPAGIDYTPVTTTLTFNPSDITQCFQVPILLDSLNEGKEDFRAEIISVPDGVSIGQPDETTISIVDSNGESKNSQSIIILWVS